MKTNAVRVLDGMNIPYELREYEVDIEDLSAETAAQKIGLPPEQVFKTLVVRGDRTGIILAVISGNTQLDLKALAPLSLNRKVETVSLKEVQPLTGYIRGGVTALACKKIIQYSFLELIEIFDIISVSAGKRGLQILLAPADYLQAVKGIVGAISQEKS
ncbi:LOW QUALITY PROTEIN: Cys-tRNA(Pro)/Cys-tRNA(Cys) deacylase [Dulcicalothrix desertica PCC 7102]|nr:LOW QUALITY PROTEIN: Cys-tRNA(Pro)/Cys-tRNA(Cys) deacylase [Dulcicalothrix desertica PCC 7102]